MAKKRAITFDTVRELAADLPGVEETTAYNTPVLKVNGRIFAGIPINKEVEPGSAMLYVADFDARDSLIAEQPDIYYVKPHYAANPIVLVRLSRVSREALEDLVRGAHRIVASKRPAKKRRARNR